MLSILVLSIMRTGSGRITPPLEMEVFYYGQREGDVGRPRLAVCDA
jgi:hypothetical protein